VSALGHPETNQKEVGPFQNNFLCAKNGQPISGRKKIFSSYELRDIKPELTQRKTKKVSAFLSTLKIGRRTSNPRRKTGEEKIKLYSK
jgi:hypothetical protein